MPPRTGYFTYTRMPAPSACTSPSRKKQLHSHGSSSLAQAGGHLSSHADKFQHPDKLVSLKKLTWISMASSRRRGPGRQQNLHADLVTVSACNDSGLGNYSAKV